MDNDKIVELTKIAKRNYYILQVFTFISAAIILSALYLYLNGELKGYGSYIYYSYFAMGVVSLILGFTFTQKINKNKDAVDRIIKMNPAFLAKFVKNRVINGFINVALIVVLIASFAMKGMQLAVMNNFFFILIIFSYWFSSYNYYMIFKDYGNKQI
jgi:O-antigen/teichoic acid export membrane protein